MKKTVRAIMLTILAFVLFVFVGVIPAKADMPIYTLYEETNVGQQSYAIWSQPVYSYLTVTANKQLMRVQGNDYLGNYVVDYYDMSYNLLRTVNIKKELPIFGAFYTDGKNYYILSGQMNSAESNSVEVYRLTKYDLNWKRLGSAGLYGADTYSPFDAGSARIESDGNLLFVRTCHEMYASPDGLHHQSNITIKYNTDSMTVVKSDGYGYVSHSFNQFIKLDGNYVIGVDHGDAFPRAIVLNRYDDISYSEAYYRDSPHSKNLVDIPGEMGRNMTGVSIGGFELNEKNYLVAGNAVNLAGNYDVYGTRNIFVAVQSKDLSVPTEMKYITSYPEGGSSPQTPHLIKVNDNTFFLLWGKDGAVYYCKLDGSGNVVGKIHSMNGALSDCVPVYYNGKLVWYTWQNGSVSFHSISTISLNANGLFDRDGTWKYYEKGVFTKKTGLVKRLDNGKWYYVEKGVLKKSTGVTPKVVSDGKLYYVKNGALATNYTGEAKGINNSKTYYVTKGKVNTTSGMYKAGGQWKYFEKGVFAAKTGMVKRPDTGNYYYVEKGIYKRVTGMVKHISNGNYYYVEKGNYKKVTGMVKHVSNGNYYYVEKGMHKKVTGMVKHVSNGNWYYVEKGMYKRVTGAVKKVSDGQWFYVQNGMLNKATGLAQRLDNGDWIYFRNGKLDKTFSGEAKKIGGDGTLYNVKNGRLVE